MKIHGFQKLTLLDFPGRVACTVFTPGCNLRCPFCHNARLVTEVEPADAMEPRDILAHLEKRRGLVDGVCVTGGEPLLQPGLPDFLREVRALGFAVKVDTNGCYPKALEALLADGLADYFAMDIKNAPAKYAATVGIPDFDTTPVRHSVDLLMQSGVDYEFRTTVVREFHEPEDIVAAAEWIRGAKRYFLQNFVDSGALIGHDLHPVSRETLYAMRDLAAGIIPETSVRGV